MSFTLKVIDDRATGMLIPDTRHSLGGIDMLQFEAFRHIFPACSCPWVMREVLYELADLHGWKVAVTEQKQPSP